MRIDDEKFKLINIANTITQKERLKILIETFGHGSYSLAEMYDMGLDNRMDISKETFRKTINHSALVGILEFQDEKYRLSKISCDLANGKCDLQEYYIQLIKKNEFINNTTEIIILLLQIFEFLKFKTIYSIFSLIDKNRLDESSVASVGRNIRSIIRMLELAGMIEKNRVGVRLRKKTLGTEIKPLYIVFNQTIINIKQITQYLSQYFTNDVLRKILSCVSTYEHDFYIWNKSSLFKNDGEIKNLLGEYIMTVTIKNK